MSLNPVAGLEHGVHNDNLLEDLGLGLGVPLTDCYSTKPLCPNTDLIARLEGAAEQTHVDGLGHHHGVQDLVGDVGGHDVVGHGVLHGGGWRDGIWQLQQAFPEDTGGGADHRLGSMKGQEHGGDGDHGLSILEMIQRDQRRDSLRGY